MAPHEELHLHHDLDINTSPIKFSGKSSTIFEGEEKSEGEP
jgi:hypothetical protein